MYGTYRRGAAVLLITAAALTMGAGVGSAQPSPGPVTVTLSQEQVTWLCEKRLPKVEQRVTKLAERIAAGAEVRGSSAWLKAKAAKERAAGRETSAQLLDERAERRSGRLDELTKIKGWASEFRSKHCGGK